MFWHWMLDKNAGQVLVCNTRKTHIRSCHSSERHSVVFLYPQCTFNILNGASWCGPSWSRPSVFLQTELLTILMSCASDSLAFFARWGALRSHHWVTSGRDLPWLPSSTAPPACCLLTWEAPPSLSWFPSSSLLHTLQITILRSFSLRPCDSPPAAPAVSWSARVFPWALLLSPSWSFSLSSTVSTIRLKATSGEQSCSKTYPHPLLLLRT